MARVSMSDLHVELSNLVFAVRLSLEPLNVDITVGWRDNIYLYVDVETVERNKMRVVDQLNQGALDRDYDYCFSVSYPTMPAAPFEYVTVRAYVDLHHPRKER